MVKSENKKRKENKMRNLKKVVPLLMVLAMLMLPMTALAAYSGIDPPSPGSPGYETMTFHLTGTVSASTAGIITFKMPWPATLVQIQAAAAAITGGAATLDLMEAGTSVLSSVITLTTAGQVYEGTISDPALAKDAAITVNLVVTTSIANGTIVLVLKRK
jgi:hypothetical protein